MTSPLAQALLASACRVPYAQAFAPRRPVILLYHGVPADAKEGVSGFVFERHVAYLREHFEFVPPHAVDRRRRGRDRVQIVLTFDDGFRNNAEVAAPILERYDVPALFFVSSRHAVPGKYLWFSYLRALERWFAEDELRFRGAMFDMRETGRSQSVARLSRILLDLTPHPAAMYDAIEGELPRLEDFVSARDLADSYAGMTAEQMARLARNPSFAFGVHTVDHPLLTRCTSQEALAQIRRNRAWIEDVCGRPGDTIAYPSGDYDAAIVAMCRDNGLRRGYAVIPRLNGNSPLEIPRIGIYAPSTEIVAFKAQWGLHLRRLGFSLG